MPVVPRARLSADPSDFRDRVQTSAARPGFHAVGIAGMQTAVITKKLKAADPTIVDGPSSSYG